MPTFPPESAPPPPLPLAIRAGDVLGRGVLAASFASIPCALRAASESHGALVAWVALAACTTLPASIAIALFRGAREGLRSFTGEDTSLATWGILTWAMTSFLSLTALGALLRATTHHHGLAGVTFAIVGLALLFALALVIRRVTAIARDADPFARASALGASIVALVVATLLVAVRAAAARASAPGGDSSGALGDALVDSLAFVIAVGIFSRAPGGAAPRAAWTSRAGIPLTLGVVTLGLALLARDPSLAAGIRAHAPLLTPLATLTGGAPPQPKALPLPPTD